MTTVLIKNAGVVVTMDESRREIMQGAVFVRDNVIEQVGATGKLPREADSVLDFRGHLVMPGMINTHHHLYQNLTRVVSAAQNASLFGWLGTLYPIWQNLDPGDVRLSTLVGMAELLFSGCTTTSDHLYLFPNGVRLDDEIDAAREIGMRFHPTRGSMSIGASRGGLPPDQLCENEDDILKDCVRVIERYHDGDKNAMLRIGLAPCSPFSVSQDLMRETANIARQYGVRLHTHLAENDEDVLFSLEKFGVRPGEYARDLGWVGDDVWHAHCVKLNDDEISLFARTSTGVAHCPMSNMRLGSGIAPLCSMLKHDVPVGLGVDGSASNDAAHLLAEARQAMLLQRVQNGAGALSARQALEIATLGGARVLGRDDIGVLAPGYAADLAAFNLSQLPFSGAQGDSVAAMVFCHPVQASHVMVNGKMLIQDGHLRTIDLPVVMEQHRLASRKMLNN